MLPPVLRCLRCAIPALAVMLVGPPAIAGETTVAVAANFTDVLTELQPGFQAVTGHDVRLVIGSTGKLYAQIIAGAPFDVLLAADQERPMRLVAADLAVKDSRFTYAVGQLTLWSADPQRIGADGPAALRAADVRHVAMAHPDLAPYGAAARATLQALGVWDDLQNRIVRAENVGQVFAMVASGNAELGFVARSAVRNPRRDITGSHWDVPAAFHAPIRQDAVLLRRGSANPAARAFLDTLAGDEARAMIQRFGYRTE